MVRQFRTHQGVHADMMRDPENANQQYAEVVQQLIKYRVESGLTQKDMAHKLETTQSAISKLEQFDYTGIKLETLRKWENALDLDLEIPLRSKQRELTSA